MVRGFKEEGSFSVYGPLKVVNKESLHDEYEKAKVPINCGDPHSVFKSDKIPRIEQQDPTYTWSISQK